MRRFVPLLALLVSVACHAALVTLVSPGANTTYRSAGGGVEVESWPRPRKEAGSPAEPSQPAERRIARAESLHHEEISVRDRDASPETPPPPAPSLGHGNADTGVAALGEEDVDEPAKLLSTPSPVYPPKALRDGAEGEVIVTFTVDGTGAVVDPSVTTSAGKLFDDAAIEAARKLRFTPARKAGHAVPVHIRWRCRFRLEDQ